MHSLSPPQAAGIALTYQFKSEMKKSRKIANRLLSIYEILNDYFGDLNWWPGETPFEIAVGAILTQNTNWINVEKAIKNLKSANLLSPGRLLKEKDDTVSGLIRPSGYYNVKTRRLKAFLGFLTSEYGGVIARMFEEELPALREKLLRVKGIGEETADSILLYGGGKPVFVVDAYTRRILARHGIIDDDYSYGDIQDLFMTHLAPDVTLYNQYHALLVNTGKQFCRPEPRCKECPLKEI
jgi:endonuclease-3 related protein